MKTFTILGMRVEATPEFMAGVRVGRSISLATREGKLSFEDGSAISAMAPDDALAELRRRGLLLPTPATDG